MSEKCEMKKERRNNFQRDDEANQKYPSPSRLCHPPPPPPRRKKTQWKLRPRGVKPLIHSTIPSTAIPSKWTESKYDVLSEKTKHESGSSIQTHHIPTPNKHIPPWLLKYMHTYIWYTKKRPAHIHMVHKEKATEILSAKGQRLRVHTHTHKMKHSKEQAELSQVTDCVSCTVPQPPTRLQK